MMRAMEALARLEAEAGLVKQHEAEYARLSAKDGHARAVVRMVAAHKREYDALVRTARDKVPARVAATAAA
jgi:hypothetical protein